MRPDHETDTKRYEVDSSDDPSTAWIIGLSGRYNLYPYNPTRESKRYQLAERWSMVVEKYTGSHGGKIQLRKNKANRRWEERSPRNTKQMLT
jgi:hypothetical protein